MTPGETDQIRLIAKTLGLGYFAVDYLRRREDDSPVFVDINVYPAVRSKARRAGRELGYYGSWHVFDNKQLLGLSERPDWDVFDSAMMAFNTSENGVHDEP